MTLKKCVSGTTLSLVASMNKSICDLPLQVKLDLWHRMLARDVVVVVLVDVAE